MTKYVLNSGGTRNHPDLARKYFLEVLKNLGPSPRLLMCCFAQSRENWERSFLEQRKLISDSISGEFRPILEIANPDTFVDQIRKSDAIYMLGGSSRLIQDQLKGFSIPTVWNDKVVATNSASSHALARQFWSCDERQCMEGLGILPLKFLAHFESEYGNYDSRGPINWKLAYQELQKYGDVSLPIHALREGEFIVIEQ